MNLHHTSETAVGTTIGAVFGFGNAMYINLKSMLLLNISWSVIGETSLLSGLGALIGLLVTFYGKILLKKIHKT